MSQSQTKICLTVILLVAFLLRIAIAWQPIPVLLKVNLPDDAYYYFAIARNILNGNGVTLDGIHVNNGFHPLWLVVILPFFLFKGMNQDLPVHFALSLGSLMDVGTCYLLYRITARITGRQEAGVVCAAFYGFNVMAVLQAANGLETALGGVLAAACWLGALALAANPTWVRVLGWGILAGLAVLARTDNGLLIIGLFVYLFTQWRRRASWPMLLAPALTWVIVVSPWLIWSQVQIGSPMQVSGIAVPYAVHTRYRMVHGDSLVAWMQGAVEQLVYGVFWLRGDFTGAPPLVGPVLWLVAAVMMIVAWNRSRRSVVMAWLPVALAAWGLVVFHAMLRWYPRPWYFMASAQALSVALGTSAVELWAVRLRWLRLVSAAGILALFMVIIWGGAAVWQIGLYPWQDRMLEAASWIARHVPEGDKVGSLNAGIYAYYSGRTVVNLDGAVNPAAYAAIRERRLMGYMQQVGVRYLVDFDYALNTEYGVFMGKGYPDGLTLIEAAALAPYPKLGTLRAYYVARP